MRFEGGNAVKVSTAGAESAGNSDASSKEERPSSPVKPYRRKKRPVEEQRADEAARRARVDRDSASSSLEALTSTLPHPFTAARTAPLPTGKPTHKQAVPTAGRGDTADQVPLTGPFVTDEETVDPVAAREAQRAENAASDL